MAEAGRPEKRAADHAAGRPVTDEELESIEPLDAVSDDEPWTRPLEELPEEQKPQALRPLPRVAGPLDPDGRRRRGTGDMPKKKTHSGAKKRFQVTGSGKLMREQANRRHYLEVKSSQPHPPAARRRRRRRRRRQEDQAPARHLSRLSPSPEHDEADQGALPWHA